MTGLVIILILAMVVLFAIEWLLRRIFRTGRIRAAGLSAVNAVARVSKPSRRCLLAEGDYQQVEKLMAKMPITPNSRW